jgi:hypothetical protein
MLSVASALPVLRCGVNRRILAFLRSHLERFSTRVGIHVWVKLEIGPLYITKCNCVGSHLSYTFVSCIQAKCCKISKITVGVAVHTCNPSPWERQEDHEFKSSRRQPLLWVLVCLHSVGRPVTQHYMWKWWESLACFVWGQIIGHTEQSQPVSYKKGNFKALFKT